MLQSTGFAENRMSNNISEILRNDQNFSYETFFRLSHCNRNVAHARDNNL